MEELKSETASRSTNYPLTLMQHVCKKMRIEHLEEYGTRIFCFSGHSYGVTTNEKWNKEFQDEAFQPYVKEHYRNELLVTLENDWFYIIRRKEDVNNEFLEHLEGAGMGNCLGLYNKKSKTGMRGYFFMAKPDDKDAYNYFVHNMSKFKKVVTQVESTFSSIGNCVNKQLAMSKPALFTPSESKLLFKGVHKDIGELKVCVDGKDYIFNPVESELLFYIKDGYTVTSLAADIGRTKSAVEYRLINIREKLYANGVVGTKKADLITFVSKLKEIVAI